MIVSKQERILVNLTKDEARKIHEELLELCEQGGIFTEETPVLFELDQKLDAIVNPKQAVAPTIEG